MNKYLVFALAVLLGCLVASALSDGSPISVSEGQAEVLRQIASEWPWLKTLDTLPWTEDNINDACNGSLSFVGACNDEGWNTAMDFTNSSYPAVRVRIPTSLANMTFLETLKLGAYFNGLLEVDLGRLKALRKLYINGAVFSEPFPSSWSGMDALEYFDWQYASTQDAQPFPSFLQGKASLWHISFVLANVSGPIPSFVGSLPSLQNLLLTGSPSLTGPLPESLTRSSTLKELYLSNIPNFDQGLSYSMPSDWSAATKLSKMSFRDIPITGSLPAKLPPSVEEFIVTRTRLSGTISQTIVDHPTMSTFCVYRADIKGSIPAPRDLENSKLSNFEVIYTEATSISENILRIKNAEILKFNNNLLGGNLPSKVGLNDATNSSLKSICFNGNQFVGNVPSSFFSKTPQLEHLGLYYNKLSGSLPASIAYASKNLKSVDFSGNSLSGQIPGDSKWADFTKLENVWMSDNYFSGSIPSGLFQRPENASKLQVFSFSNNRLDICTLPFENYTVPSDIATICSVGDQTPKECACVGAWPESCTNYLPIEPTCAPNAPLDPIPIAPFNAPGYVPSPSSQGSKIRANSLPAIVFALASLVAFALV